MAPTPAVGSRWQHRNGNRYRVLALANTDSDNHEKYPPTVVYQGPNGKVWSRRLSDWERNFTALPPVTEPSPTEGMNIAQRILHVGGRNTASGYIEFGSIQAVEALVRQVLRDLQTERAATPQPCSFGSPELQELILAKCVEKDRAARAQADSVTAPAGGVDDAVDVIALARYKVVPAHESMFHRFAVVAGDGKQQLYLGREVECENMARKFAGAFLDGAFYQSNIAPTPPAPTADSVTTPADGANWQDISTAPKDGTRFVAVGNNYGRYSETQHTCIAQWFRGCWMEVSDWNEASELKYLTHWMPLPPLPGSAARKQGANHD